VDIAVSQPRPVSALERSIAGTAAFFMPVGAGLLWYFDPTKAGFFPVCPLYSLTGFACPGCGMTRGFHALLHGDIAGALGFNAMIPLFLLLFGFIFVTLFSVATRGKGFMRLTDSPKFLVGFLVVLVVFGFVRNLPIYPLTLLFP